MARYSDRESESGDAAAAGDRVLKALNPGAEWKLSATEGSSGVELLEGGIDAFAIRRLLVERAERTIDLQYYIWHDDLTGALMLEYLRRAALRGVHVRLLVDDNGISGLDQKLRWLALSPNIAVRIFNPFHSRRFKPLDLLFRFRAANRRMHSKSFTIDNAVTIVGGRNIGDEYFAAKQSQAFADLDALCVGPVVGEVSDCFEQFWASSGAVPVETVVDPLSTRATEAVESEMSRRIRGSETRDYERQLAQAQILDRIANGGLEFTWAPVRLVSDSPDKALTAEAQCKSLPDALTDIIGEPEHELLIVSGYFVPAEDGVRALAEMVGARGIAVQVLTNSYAALDVGVVHAGYAEHRQRLVEAGVELFEMPAPGDQPKTNRKLAHGILRRSAGAPGPMLHAKLFCIDAKRLYVGSLNFDPRSFLLNTELGIVIDCAPMARRIQDLFKGEVEQNSYRLVVDDGGLGWIDERDDDPELERTEPGTSVISRVIVAALGRLPIDWLL